MLGSLLFSGPLCLLRALVDIPILLFLQRPVQNIPKHKQYEQRPTQFLSQSEVNVEEDALEKKRAPEQALGEEEHVSVWLKHALYCAEGTKTMHLRWV